MQYSGTSHQMELPEMNRGYKEELQTVSQIRLKTLAAAENVSKTIHIEDMSRNVVNRVQN